MPEHKVLKRVNLIEDSAARRVVEWKEWIDDELVFDINCDLCNYHKHHCHGCGDAQDHSGKSTTDRHITEDCLEDH